MTQALDGGVAGGRGAAGWPVPARADQHNLLPGADPQDFNAFPENSTRGWFATLVGALDATSRIIGNPLFRLPLEGHDFAWWYGFRGYVGEKGLLGTRQFGVLVVAA